ncbi:MAG: OmpH family outer membrane protein [Termitinemataceae bacterium]|nr:MAG: OmpH family outer membrane protein [Termitinemataceae bacterium]
MIKKQFFLFTALFLCFSIHAQQITKFAVVDLGRIYREFAKDSKAEKDFNERSAKVQEELDKQANEIKALQSTQAEAALQGDSAKVKTLENELNKKKNALQSYYQAKTAELEDIKKRVASSPSADFSTQLSNEIRYVAESGGYSMVLNKNETKSIVWSSPSVDITDSVINRLKARVK